jgi:hypothetical protein
MCTCCDSWNGNPANGGHRGHVHGALSFETLLTDPMTRMVMESDGVSVAELIKVLEDARDAIALREAAPAALVEAARVGFVPGM